MLNPPAKFCDKLIIRWCRSHQAGPEYAGNNRADALANGAANNVELEVAKDAPLVSMSTLKSIWRDRIDDLWSFNWQRLNECRQTKLFFPTINKGLSYKVVNSSRQLWGVLNRWYTGHGFLNRHNFLVYGPKDEAYYPQCDLCSYGDHELQTPSHLISVCPYFFELRAQIFGFYTLESPYTLPFSKMCQFLLQSDLVDLQWEDGVNHTT